MIEKKELHHYDILMIEDQMSGLRERLADICQNKSNTCYIMDKKVLVGIVTPGDFKRYIQNEGTTSIEIDKIMNRNYFRVYHDTRINFKEIALNIFKANKNIKTIPVVDYDNTLLYFFELIIIELTSISDNYSYPNFCDYASRDTYAFNNFRTNETYTKVLEHVTEEQGKTYLDFIYAENSKIMEDIQIYSDNDLYGGAETSYYEGAGHISPSTLRYVAILADIDNKFGSLDGMKICEIGVGYGGQCRILSTKYRLKSYTLIDLPQVLNLAKRYLNCYPINTKLIFSTMNELDPSENYDLFISNYAFSEIKYELQECYYSKTIKNSKRGYILYNNIEEFNFKRLTLEDYEKRISNLNVTNDILPGSKNNKLLFW